MTNNGCCCLSEYVEDWAGWGQVSLWWQAMSLYVDAPKTMSFFQVFFCYFLTPPHTHWFSTATQQETTKLNTVALVNIWVAYSPQIYQIFTLNFQVIHFLLFWEWRQNFTSMVKRQSTDKTKKKKMANVSWSRFKLITLIHSLENLSCMPSSTDQAVQLPVHLQNVDFGAYNSPYRP